MATHANSTHAPSTDTARAIRLRAERAVDQLIALLDALDGDPDLEPDLGWSKTMAFGVMGDGELDGDLRGGALVRAA